MMKYVTVALPEWLSELVILDGMNNLISKSVYYTIMLCLSRGMTIAQSVNNKQLQNDCACVLEELKVLY